MAEEYCRLSQKESDLDSGYTIRPKAGKRSLRSCLFSTCILLGIVIILSGAIALVLGLFYGPQLSKIINSITPSSSSASQNSTLEILAEVNATLAEANQTLFHNTTSSLSKNKTNVQESTSEKKKNGTHESIIIDDKNQGKHEINLNVTSGDEHPHLNDTLKFDSEGNETESESKRITETEEKFANLMIKLEKAMENSTGIHRPELVVPLFMFISFVSLLLLSVCCCCIMMKRREHSRRRLLGKIITDLQTGDSKSELLHHDDD